MPGLGFGFGSRSSHTSGIAQLVLAPGALTYASVRFPPENGEDPVSLATSTAGENGILYLPGTAGLVSTGAPFGASSFCIMALITLDQRRYNANARQPHIFANGFINATTPTSRTISLMYATRTASATNPGKFTCAIRGETGESAGAAPTSQTVPLDVVNILVAVRSDNTNWFIDFWDCDTGTKYAGTPIAKPSGWLGVKTMANLLTLGAHTSSLFPRLSNSTTGNSISGYRGNMEFVAMLDINPSDTQLGNIAAGDDPVTTLGSGNFRLWLPTLTAGAITTTATSNQAGFTNKAVTQAGTIYPGSNIRRQAQAKYLKRRRVSDPCIYPVRPGENAATAYETFDFAGLTAGDPVQLRVQDEDGYIVGTDWRTVGTVPASGSTLDVTYTLPFHPSDKFYRLTFRVSNGAGDYVYWRANGDHVVALTVALLDQSGGVRALRYGNTLAKAWQNDQGRRSFVLAPDYTNASSLVLRSRYMVGAIGTSTDGRQDGWIFLTERLREYTTKPLCIVDLTLTGTSIPSLLDDSDDGGGGRKWSDLVNALAPLMPRDSAGRRALTSVVTPWAVWFAGAGQSWAGQMYRPLVLGQPSANQGAGASYKVTSGQLNHYLLDNVTIDPKFRMVVMPLYRFVTAFDAASDAYAGANDRKDMRDNVLLESTTAANGQSVFSLVIGHEGTNHSVVSTVDVHPNHSSVYGIAPWTLAVADSMALGLGVASKKGPFYLDTYSFVGGAPSATVKASVSAGGTLDTWGNLFAAQYGGTPGAAIGQSVEGFEVSTDGGTTWTHTGFTASITAANEVTIVKTSGTWPAGTKFRHRPGSPGGYSTDPTGAAANYAAASAAEVAWIKGAVFCDGVAVAGDNTAWTVA